MEKIPIQNLTLEERQQAAGSPGMTPGPGQGAAAPQAVPQLPPQMFTTAAQLLDLTDKKILAWLRDGKKLFGVLRSWDQFGNIVLESAYERFYSYSQRLWADVPKGLFVVRGENVLLIGEVDLDVDDEPLPAPWRQGNPEEVKLLCKREAEEKSVRDKERRERLRRLGFDGDGVGKEPDGTL